MSIYFTNEYYLTFGRVDGFLNPKKYALTSLNAIYWLVSQYIVVVIVGKVVFNRTHLGINVTLSMID